MAVLHKITLNLDIEGRGRRSGLGITGEGRVWPIPNRNARTHMPHLDDSDTSRKSGMDWNVRSLRVDCVVPALLLRTPFPSCPCISSQDSRGDSYWSYSFSCDFNDPAGFNSALYVSDIKILSLAQTSLLTSWCAKKQPTQNLRADASQMQHIQNSATHLNAHHHPIALLPAPVPMFPIPGDGNTIYPDSPARNLATTLISPGPRSFPFESTLLLLQQS